MTTLYHLNPRIYLALSFYAVVIFLLSRYLLFLSRIAPKALDRWADEQGFKVVKRDQVGTFKRMTTGASNTQAVYSIVVIDEKGRSRSGLVKLGVWGWPSLSLDRCPIEVYWDKTQASPDWPEL